MGLWVWVFDVDGLYTSSLMVIWGVYVGMFVYRDGLMSVLILEVVLMGFVVVVMCS